VICEQNPEWKVTESVKKCLNKMLRFGKVWGKIQADFNEM
jgi:hypothetical protein